MNYIPFLKFKVNEVAAVKSLSLNDIKRLTPFFDLPRKDILDSNSLKSLIDTAYRKYEINLLSLPFFYLDNFDINDAILINGDDNYLYTLEKFSTAKIVPVVGLDRSYRRNSVVIEAKKNKLIKLDIVALRICVEDLVSYTLVEEEIKELLNELKESFTSFHLIIDNRVCHNINIQARATQIIKFINDICSDAEFDKIIITGSSITASIKDLLDPNTVITIERSELNLFKKVKNEIDEIHIGDYTAVSPSYSDVKIRGEYMRKVTAPKLMYIFDKYLHIKRGGAIDGHPRGNKQYNDLSAILIKEAYFRGGLYSFGDKYIDEKAQSIGKDASPSTIPKALINAHITYMLNGFKI
ncbi:hypothetical protein [Pseudoalteromonas sp. Z9A5]|jgi:hypothetical protein|uniref:beta family protein n=1 Tax=Pseudoalteromonas sp. Z9A5 TaxID=2686355 RepID=UPI0014083DD4|nr:hypothetical protein [Pseudoalteromonas sp. Z9A5]